MANEDLPLGCFGKLPFWPEYLEHGAGMPTARAFREWLHRGKEASSLTGSEEQQVATDVGIRNDLRLMLGAPGSAELLVGVLRASRDRGGRNFPFAVFTHVSRRSFGKRYPMLPLALAPVWESLEEAWEALASVASKGSYEELLGTIRVPQPAPPKEVARTYDGRQSESAGGLFETQDGASPDGLAEQFPGVVGRLKQRDAALSLKLPVSGDREQACYDASFWIDLLNRQFMLRRLEPSVLLEGAYNRPSRSVFLRFGALDPLDFSHIMGLAEENTEILRPAHGSPGGPDEVVSNLTYGDLIGGKFGGRS